MSKDTGLMDAKLKEGEFVIKEIYTSDVHIDKQGYIALQTNPGGIEINYGEELADGPHTLQVVLPGEGAWLTYVDTGGRRYDTKGTLTVTVSERQIKQKGNFNVSFLYNGKGIQMEGTFEGKRSI
ncbi:hypothetical protein [Pseudomonas frederiksbergensis]|uniref:hypothetical protein n=1 Tax=Pseudomonas frederiksbergensis TaxID=104087 RepID=UPI003D1E9475